MKRTWWFLVFLVCVACLGLMMSFSYTVGMRDGIEYGHKYQEER